MKNIKTKIISFVTSFLLAFAFVSLLPEGTFTASALTFKKDIKGKDYILKNEIKGLTINDKAPNGMAVFGGTGAVSDRTVDEIISVIR